MAHFFAATESMRRILIDNVCRKRAARHGGRQARVNIDEVELAEEAKDEELLGFAKRWRSWPPKTGAWRNW